MILTPQQEALAPILREHLYAGDERVFVIEGLSGTGKSTVVQNVLAAMGKSGTVVDRVHRSEVPPDHVAVVDYYYPEQIVRIREAIGELVHPMIVLAHPRFASMEGLGRVDHVQDLEAAGISSVIHRLDPMNDQEAASHAGQREDLIRQYGLGIGGHIRTLLNDPLLDELRATFLTTAKLHQILGHASRFHQDHTARAEALLGRTLSSRLKVELERTNFYSLEHRLATIDPNLGPILPRHPETLQMYQNIIDLRGPDCYGIDVLVPHVEPAVLTELGLIDGDLESQGYLMRIASSCIKAWVVTRTQMDGGFDDRRSLRRTFDEWGNRASAYGYLHGLELPAAGENPLWVRASTHGGFRKPDSPLFTYAAETLLQARGIPYDVRYLLMKDVMKNVVHHVTENGVRVA